MTAAVAEDRLAALETKIDGITHQLDYVAAALRDQEVRRGMWDELRRDLAPVTTEAMERVSRELDEVRDFIAPHDLLRLVKRLLRDLPYLEALLDQVESLQALGADLSPLGRDMLVAAMARLDHLERRGYFSFAAGLMQVTDRVVGSFDREDLQALADGGPALAAALKEITRPELLGLLPGLLQALAAPDEKPPGLWRLGRRLRRPAARRGLARALAALEALGGPAGTRPAGPSDPVD